ncbi:hypothetical protein FJZ36_10040 [Candidatus Poribacteria bacterium]|nr:hypothetical protein [Candidatus Poribacteria bacterium]
MTRTIRQTQQMALTATVAAGMLFAAAGAEAQATTTVTFGVYVPPIVRWLTRTGDATATLGLQYDPATPETNEVSVVFPLMTNVDVTLTADVTPFTNPDDPTDTLDTTWMVTDDADGDASRSGVQAADADAAQGYGAFVPGEDFLRRGVRATHAPSDGNVKFRVTARGDRSDAAATSGYYEATVVLTAIPYASASGRKAR